ncbi:hypothetical protein RHGRI_016268 [Rhododendron griersonianum]|uniref:Uncharacterized protein n=1 Tax=Rhododendron griersonianum TaxID=479676 RepID=A0AAV6JTJ9_9ERIC|nr:hypothetical protein RHGRI_016268 [Rhododendron griersonianum]
MTNFFSKMFIKLGYLNKEGDSPNGATSALPTEPTANYAEDTFVMVAQPSELPTSPTDETNQHFSLPNVEDSTSEKLYIMSIFICETDFISAENHNNFIDVYFLLLVYDHQNEEPSCKGPSENQIKLHSDQVKADCYDKFQAKESDEAACMPSNSDLHEWGQSNLMDTIPRAGSTSSQAFSSRSLHPSSQFLSRFNFIPGNGNVSFRLSRATSLGSSRQGLDYEDFGSRNLESHPSATGFFESLQSDQNTSGLNVARDINNGVELNFFNLHSPRVIFWLYFG